MKLFFYNRTSLSNVIIRKYFVCDISLDSIPRSCHLIQMTDPFLTTISGTGAAPLPGYHRHISLCHTHIQVCKPFSGPIVGTKNLMCYIAHGFSNNTIITSISMEWLCKSIFSNSPRKQLLLYFLVRQQATARQSNTWSSSSNMSDQDDSNIWILRISYFTQTALSRWGARDLTLLCLWCSSPRPAYRQPWGCPYMEMLNT